MNQYRQAYFIKISGLVMVLLMAACSHAPKQFIAPKQKIAMKHEQLGNQYYERGRTKDALREWQVALALDSDRADLNKRIESVESGKQWDQKKEPLGNHSKGKQEKINHELKKAENYYKQSQLKDADVTWRHILSLDIANPTARQGLDRLRDEVYQKDSKRSFDLMTEDLYLQGMRCYRKSDWESALSKLGEAANLNADQPQVKKYLAMVQKEVRQFADQQTVDQLIEEAGTAEKKEKWLEANRIWKKVLAFESQHVQALSGVKRSQAQLEKWSKTETRKADRYFQTGHYSRAMTTYQRVLNVFPRHRQARQGKKRASQARQAGNKSASQKTQAEKEFNKGVEHYRQGRLSQAIALWEKAVQKDPNDAEYQEWLTRAKKEKSGSDEQNKQRAQVTYQDGLAAYQRGELNKAYLLWKETLELDPTHQKAKTNIQKIKQEME